MKRSTTLLQGMTFSFMFQQVVSGVGCIETVNCVGPKTGRKKNPPMNFFLDLHIFEKNARAEMAHTKTECSGRFTELFPFALCLFSSFSVFQCTTKLLMFSI